MLISKSGDRFFSGEYNRLQRRVRTGQFEIEGVGLENHISAAWEVKMVGWRKYGERRIGGKL